MCEVVNISVIIGSNITSGPIWCCDSLYRIILNITKVKSLVVYMDVGTLLIALENVKNESLLKEDISSIEESKDKILKTLHLSKSDYGNIRKKLNTYCYVDELPDMKYGSYIRWINIRDPSSLCLTNGGIVCELKVTDKGLIVVCRNNNHKYFQINMSEALIFRKLSEQERVLLSALEFINRSS